MAQHYLATYLNDHLAGAQLALELLAHLENALAGTPEARFAAALRAEIDADRRELEGVMARAQVTVSLPRKAAGWLGEQMAALKLRLDDPAAGALRVLEVFEAVSIGIEGKRLLWRSLATAAAATPELAGTDYARLQERAEEQRRHVETVRIAAARAALAGRAAPVGPPA